MTTAVEAAHRDDLTFRPYSPADWEAVCGIHDATRPQELAAAGVDARAFRSMAEAAEKDEFFVSTTVVACLQGAVVGFVSWNEAYVTWLYVDPAVQRRGVGRRLLDHALSAIGPEAWITMLAGNDAAMKLYSRAGMEVVSARPGLLEGYPATGLRLALPTSRMRDPLAARRRAGE